VPLQATSAAPPATAACTSVSVRSVTAVKDAPDSIAPVAASRTPPSSCAVSCSSGVPSSFSACKKGAACSCYRSLSRATHSSGRIGNRL